MRRSCNFQLSEIIDSSLFPDRSSTMNQFGNFIYKDHVTRIKYNVENLKSKKKPSTMYQNQTIESFMKTHKQTKSMESMTKPKSKFRNSQMDDIQIKKNELVHFLQHLEMMKKIRKNRNHIVSGAEKIEKRQSVFPNIIPQYLASGLKVKNIDLLKQQIRKQVNELSTELFREYMSNSESYRTVFNELNTISSKGALNTSKIKQIRQKIEECTKRKNPRLNKNAMTKKRQLDSKENNRYDQYFSTLAKQIDEEIHLKIKHESTFNWKFGKRQSFKDATNQSHVSFENNKNA